MKTENIITYDNMSVFAHGEKYYAADEDGIYEVKLVKKIPSSEYEDDVVDLQCDYSGMSDDLQWCLGFNKAKNKIKAEGEYRNTCQ